MMPGASAKASKVQEQAASSRLKDSGSASARLGGSRLKQAGGKAADRLWGMADDQADDATHLSNRAVSIGAKGANKTRHGVGRTARAARRVMNRGKRQLLDGKAKKTGVKGKLRTVGRKAAKGVRNVEHGIDSAGRQVGELGSDLESRTAATVGRYSTKAPGTAVRGGVKAVKAGVRTVRTAKQAASTTAHAAKATAKGVQAAAQATARAVQAAVHTVHAAVAAAASAIAAAGIPVVAVMAAILVVVALVSSIIGALTFKQQREDSQYANQRIHAMLDDIVRAGGVCEEVAPSLLAGQLEAESNFDERAESPAGAQGIAQFMPGTWKSVGMDGDDDGVADVFNFHDAIWTQGNYMCSLAGQVKALQESGAIHGDTTSLTLAAYNAGIGNVTRAGGVPDFEETRNYIARIGVFQQQYLLLDGEADGDFDDEDDDEDGETGTPVPGDLKPALKVGTDGTVSTKGIDLNPGASYAWGQCTWWAAIRRAQIGRPVDPYMGNGGDWAASGRRLGYKVSGTPHAGDAMCFGRGVLTADSTYGHIAVVESVEPNGDITISEANVRGVGVVTLRHITAAQLKAAGSGVQFIQ